MDLSGTRDGVLTFDFAYGEYGIKNKTFTATVEASTDGGKTWNAIWNFQDSYTGQQASNYIISGSAEVPVPAEYNVDGVQFAFRYVHPNEDTTGQLAIDNVKLMAVEDGPVAQKYTITATAGEGGSITPAGEVSVKEGASQTFAIAAQEGYAIADVLVDGQSVGAVDSYTFENVTANHTIAAVFTKTASDVQFDNDFESENFPGHGWTVKGTRTDSPYTWYKGTNTKLNSTKQARIDMDYYEDSWGDWSVGGIRKPLLPMAGGSDKLQDEYLISPVVDLTGKTPTLTFDYLLFRYAVLNGFCTITVEASTDGGQTWTAIWDAKTDTVNEGGTYLQGTASIAVPAAYCTDNAQFAFHFYKKASKGYTGTDGMNAIDNVTMTYGTTDPCADGHTLTAVPEVPATCEETGVKAHWVCSVCGKLFSDAEGKNETTLEALTIPAAGHAWGQPVWTWTGYGAAEASFACARDAGHVKVLPASITSEVTTQPGCSTEGVRTYTATVTLDGKNYTDTRTETLPSLGHKTQLVGAKAATCTEDGYTGDEVCTVCGVTVRTGTVEKAKDHSWGVGKVTKGATCQAEGEMSYTCTVCGETKTIPVDKTDHKIELQNEKEASCTVRGYTGDKVCTVCGEVVEKGEYIDPSHSWNGGTVTRAPTSLADGVMTYTCTKCGATKTESIPHGSSGIGGTVTGGGSGLANPSAKPKTGDEANALLLAVVMLSSMTAVVVTARKLRKEK